MIFLTKFQFKDHLLVKIIKQLLIIFLIPFWIKTLFIFSISDIPSQNKSLGFNEDTTLVSKKDTLYLVVQKEEDLKTSFNWQKNMPWIGAVLVGLLTILANIIINSETRRFSKELTEKQLNNSKNIALV